MSESTAKLNLRSSKYPADKERLDVKIEHLKRKSKESWSWINQTISCLKILQEFWIEHGADFEEVSDIDREEILGNLQKTWEQVNREIIRHQNLERRLIKVNNKLQQICSLDELTSVANRYRFEQDLKQEWQRSHLNQYPLSLILCDLDDFKEYNQEYGHKAGDDCLRKVAQAIRKAVKRPADLVARYSGTRFAVLLPNTYRIQAQQLAEIIRSEVEQLKIPHAKSTVSEYVTLSLGLATSIPKDEQNSQSFLSSANEALAAAQKSGRNCIKWGDSQQSRPEKTSIVINLLDTLKGNPSIGWHFEKQSIIRIGREQDNDIIFHSCYVSRYHLELIFNGEQWQLICLGQNGTYIDNQKIDRVVLENGTIIQLAVEGPILQINLPSAG